MGSASSGTRKSQCIAMTATGGPSANSVAADQLRNQRSVRRCWAIEPFWRSASAVRVNVELAAKKTTAASDDGRDVGGLEVVAVEQAGPAHGLEREPGEHPRDRELREVEDDAVERPAADEVGDERGDHLHGHHLRDAVTEEQREGERRGEGLLADLAVDLDREQLADEDERGEHPELGVGGAEVAGPEEREPGDDG